MFGRGNGKESSRPYQCENQLVLVLPLTSKSKELTKNVCRLAMRYVRQWSMNDRIVLLITSLFFCPYSRALTHGAVVSAA